MIPFSKRSLKPVDRLLARAERGIALISRCRPTNATAEEARLSDLWARGCREPPRFRYAHVPELGELRRGLQQIQAELAGDHPILELYVQRAEELALETEMVEKIGTREFAALSARRFSPNSELDAAQAESLAVEWMHLVGGENGPTYRSDDVECPDSLVTQMRACVGALRLPVAVELTDALTAAAATGERTIFVARNRQLSRAAAARIVYHEVHGHAVPRVRASAESIGLFSVGSARGNDEQEGYALWLEERAGLMENSRKRELAGRHLAAVGVRRGATFVETVEMLQACGSELELSLQIAVRTHRAGGLAREIVYLSGFLRVRRALEQDPDLAEWFKRGRVSLEAATALRRYLGSNSARTGI